MKDTQVIDMKEYASNMSKKTPVIGHPAIFKYKKIHQQEVKGHISKNTPVAGVHSIVIKEYVTKICICNNLVNNTYMDEYTGEHSEIMC